MSANHDEGHGSSDALAGMLLMGAAVLAMIMANTPLADLYGRLIGTRSRCASVRSRSRSRCCCGSTTG